MRIIGMSDCLCPKKTKQPVYLYSLSFKKLPTAKPIPSLHYLSTQQWCSPMGKQRRPKQPAPLQPLARFAVQFSFQCHKSNEHHVEEWREIRPQERLCKSLRHSTRFECQMRRCVQLPRTWADLLDQGLTWMCLLVPVSGGIGMRDFRQFIRWFFDTRRSFVLLGSFSKTNFHGSLPFTSGPLSGDSSCCTNTMTGCGLASIPRTEERISAPARRIRSACGISVFGSDARSFWISMTKRALLGVVIAVNVSTGLGWLLFIVVLGTWILTKRFVTHTYLSSFDTYSKVVGCGE